MDKNLTVKEMASELIKQGHQVVLYRRKDGGYLIKSIDGQKFSGANGNARARQILGTSISEARIEQTKMATKHKKKIKEKKMKRPEIDVAKEIEKAQKRINRKRRAKGIKGGGIVTKSKIKWSIEHKGEEETLKLLEQQEIYAEGFAYNENVEHIKARIEGLYQITQDDNFRLMNEEIDKYKRSQKYRSGRVREYWAITDEQLWIIQYEILNEVDKGLSSNIALAEVKFTLRAKGIKTDKAEKKAKRKKK